MIYTVGINIGDFQEVSVKGVKKYFRDRTVVQYDSETEGFDPHIDKVLCFQLGDYDNQFVIHAKHLPEFKDFLESKTLIGQNLKFDLRFLYTHGIWPTKVWDTFLAESVLYCGIKSRKKSLADLARNYLDISLDKSVRDTIITQGILSDDAIEYSANDVKYLEKIKEAQELELAGKDLKKALALENEFVLVLAYIEYCGFKLDKNKWQEKCDKDRAAFKAAEKVLNDYIIDNKVEKYLSYQIDLFAAHDGAVVMINWSSPKQVLEVFGTLGIPVGIDKAGKRSVAEKEIAKYAKEYPFIDKYLEYKGYEKLVGTYGENFLQQINPKTGRLHTSFKQLMDTGRLSSGGNGSINFQNIPGDPFTRSCFVAEEGNTLLISDYSGQEQVVLANKSLDKNLLAFYETGGADMHSFVASKMYPDLDEDYNTMDIEDFKKKHKPQRQAAKTAGFAINYGGNGSTIARNNNMSPEEGEFVYEAYFKAFPGLKDYFKKVQEQALRDGYILINEKLNRKTFIGGFEEWEDTQQMFSSTFWDEYRSLKEANFGLPVVPNTRWAELKDKVSTWFKTKGAIERMALNYPIQGTSAEITKISGVYFFRWIREHNYFNTVLFPNTIHDENVVECPLEIADEVSEALGECMNRAGDWFCTTVKLTAVPEASPFWKK